MIRDKRILMLKSMSKRKQAEQKGAAAAALLDTHDKQQSSGEASLSAVSKFHSRVSIFEPYFSPLFEPHCSPLFELVLLFESSFIITPSIFARPGASPTWISPLSFHLAYDFHAVAPAGIITNENTFTHVYSLVARPRMLLS